MVLDHSISYREYFVQNDVSVGMIKNHISALKANFMLYGLDHHLMDYPWVRYFANLLKT